MKITVKTLSGETVGIEVEAVDTVLSIKHKIQQIKGFEVTQQKLLRKGALIQDEKTVQELGIQDGDFLVVMVNVKKQAPPVPPVQQQQQQAPQPVQQPQPVVPQPAVQIQGESTLVHGAEYDNAIKEMISMGFTKVEAEAAMRAAFNNPERAIEYLLNGIPANQNVVPPSPIAGNQSPLPAQVPVAGQQGASQVLQQLMQSPQFQQIRALAQQNPQAFLQMMPQLMQAISQQNPQLYALIQQNPEAFMAAIIGGGQGAGGAGNQVQIQLTEPEKVCIDNMVALGFSKNDSLEAFLACDRNEEQALNYLFDKQERGDLLSQHIEREQNDPQNQGHEGPEDDLEGEGEADDDDDIYH